MPDTTISIDRDQRDGLYELIRNHLGAIGDIQIALEENEDFATAERLGLEFGEDFRLLDDLGWRPREDGDSFALTMPRHCLMEALKRLRGEADEVLDESGTERESRQADAETDARFQLGMNTCEEMLVDLANGEGERA
jgi:hypothetical protein